jgi:hypothetical protein
MSRHVTMASAFAAALLLAACATMPPYGPRASNWGAGYTEQTLDERSVQVSYAGGRSTPRKTVEAGLALRAAELAITAGFSHVELGNIAVASDLASPFVSPSLSVGWHSAIRSGWSWGFGWNPWAYDPFFPARTIDTRTTASAIATFLTADEAKSRPAALDAVQVVANLRPQFERKR